MGLSRTYQVSFCGSTPLKIRGVRGVMEITPFIPFIPLTLRGRFKERILILRGILKEMGGIGVVYETK